MGKRHKCQSSSKPVAGAGAYETALVQNRHELNQWMANSESYTSTDFMFLVKLEPSKFMAIVLHTPAGFQVPAISRSMTPFCNFVQKSHMIRETHMRRENPEFSEVAQFALDIYDKLNLDGEGYCVYFVDCMGRADGSFAVMEVQSRHPAGFFVTAICEEMYGGDAESYTVAWPFLSYVEDEKKILYNHACCLIYPTPGGVLVENHMPDLESLVPRTQLEHITHMLHLGELLPPKPLSIDYMVCELGIVGEDLGSVTRSADVVAAGFKPVSITMPKSD